MKRKFIFLAMLLLTLIGGVNWNVLNAQDPGIKIGEDKQDASPTGMYPMYGSWYCSISQQIFTAAEIGVGAGNITSIAFKTSTAAKDHNITVWLLNTTNSTLDSPMAFGDSDKVFEGTWNSGAAGTWSQITLDRAFSYNGDNLVVILQENGTGSTDKFYKYTKGAGTTLQYKYASYVASLEGLSGYYTSTYNNVFGLTIESGEVVPPSVPKNLTATAIDHASISLAWDAAENANKYYVYKDGEYLDETSATNYTVNNLSDGKEYCFTVKSVYNSSNVSEESAPDCATTAVLPTPATPTNLAATSVTHYSATLTWDEVEYAESYTVSYETTEITVTENTCVVTGLTPETPYTFSVKANNIKGSSVATTILVTTSEYNNPFEGKQFRIMVNSGNATGKYLNIFAYNKQSGYSSNYSSVGATAKANSEMQKFVIEDAGNGNYYLKNIAGYYIKCAQWNVDAYSQTEKTALTFEYLEGSDGPFYLRDSEYTDGKTNNYFKVEYSTSGAYYYNYHVYCDQPIDNSFVVTWVLEEVVLTVDVTADNNQIYDDQTTTLQANIEGASGDCSYSWTLNGEVVGTEATYTFTPSTTGEYTFTCTVTDSKNATATDNVTVNVNARPALAISNITAEKELIYNNDETTTLTANATNGYAPYTYSWTLNEEVVGTNATYTFSNKTVGEYTLTCTVKDSRNNTATASKTITVKDISEKPLEITIGTNTTYDKYMPTHAYYGNSYTQQIYTAAEIGIDGGTITEIAFMKYNSNTADRKIKVFMLNTTKESFVSTSNWVTVGDNDLVFDGTCNFSGNAGEWTTITLTNEFNYTGGNILLCVSDYTNSWVESYPQFYVYEGNPSNRSLYTYQDSYPYGDNCSKSGTRRSVLNHIKFNYKPAAPKAPKAPTNLAVLNDENIFIEKDRDLVLTWDVVDNATGYNVYKNDELVGQTTETTYTVPAENVVYNATPITYAVSAKNDAGESEEKSQVSVIVTGYGNINGVVTDKETKKELTDITILLSGTTAFGEDKYDAITLEDGSFNKDVLEGTYTLTITHDDYEEFVSTEIIDVIYGGDTYVEIELTAKPEAIFTVTATESGNNANIAWDAEYASYNIYRKDTKTGEVEELGRNISANQYQDTDWLSLENTAYQYGVSANVISGTTYGVIDEFDFEEGKMPAGWNALEGWWEVNSTSHNSGFGLSSPYSGDMVIGHTYIVTCPTLINTTDAILSFWHQNVWYGTSPSNLYVYYSTSPDGPWENTLFKTDKSYDTWTYQEIPLSSYPEQIYIAFGHMFEDGDGAWVDDILIQGNVPTYKESKINWSNVLKKAVFLGTVDTDWNTAANWSTGQVPGENNNVTIAANAEISSDVTVNTITINENASLSVNNAVLNVTYGIYNTTAANLIFSDGAQIIQPKDNVAATFNMNINPTVGDWNENNTTGWQFISLPFADAEFEDFTANSEDYDLYKYNGNKDNEWSNHKYVPTTETITVGGGDNVESYMPSSINYNYTVSQQIYLAEDLQGKTGEITGYSFKHAKNLTNNGFPYTTTRQFEIYMINTGKSYFESGSDWVNVQDSDLVFSGSVSISTIGWVTIEFDTPFKYEEGKNVILCINDITGAFTPIATNYYRMNDTEKNRSIHARRDDGGKYNPSEFDISGTMQKYVAQAEFLFESNTDGDIFGDTFQQGLGYLASYKSETTATFEGTLNNETTFYYEVSHNADKYLANFHLLGNPFTFNMEWSKVQGEGLVEGYAIVNNEGGYDYLTTGTIPVGDGFFVKANAEDPTLYYDHSYVAPVLRGSEKSNSINVIATGKAGKDNVVINFAGQSEGFDKLQNFNKDIATVFVANNGKRYGIANVDEDLTEVELSFAASQMGNYSISLDVNGEFETVTLVDRFTGVETNMLLEDEYTFTATSNDNVNRFVIKLANGQEPTANSQFVYQSGEELILSIEGSVQIVDMLGRVVYSNEHANGNNRISVSEFNNAAYVVRVVNEEGVKSQKVVIY